jgi:hypothetical protein
MIESRLQVPTVLASLVVSLALGCSKETPSQATTTTSATPATTPAAPPPKKEDCPGATKVEEMGFCITLPAGYAADPPKKGEDPSEPWSVDFTKNGSNFDGFTVRAKTDTLADEKKSSAFFLDKSKYEVRETGDLAGGKGWFFFSSRKGAEGGTVGVYVQAAKYVIVCESAGNVDPKVFKAKLDVCKTITPIGG